MGSAIGLREGFDGASLRRLARMTTSANQGRWLLALAKIYGGSRGDGFEDGGEPAPIGSRPYASGLPKG